MTWIASLVGMTKVFKIDFTDWYRPVFIGPTMNQNIDQVLPDFGSH